VPLTTHDAENIAAAFQGARPDCRPRTCKLPECGRAPGHSSFTMRAFASADWKVRLHWGAKLAAAKCISRRGGE
jgi:hypothetical protein